MPILCVVNLLCPFNSIHVRLVHGCILLIYIMRIRLVHRCILLICLVLLTSYIYIYIYGLFKDEYYCSVLFPDSTYMYDQYVVLPCLGLPMYIYIWSMIHFVPDFTCAYTYVIRKFGSILSWETYIDRCAIAMPPCLLPLLPTKHIYIYIRKCAWGVDSIYIYIYI